MSNLFSTSNPYGRDLATQPNADGLIDLTPEMNEVEGLDVLIQRTVRRQVMPKGSDLSSSNDGINLIQYVKAGLTQQQISAVPGVILTELLRDQCILRGTTVTAEFNASTNILTVQEDIISSAGPFSLTLTIDKVSVQVLVNSQ